MLLQLLKNCGQILGDDKDVGMDCSIVALNNIPGNFSLVSTTDFFFPAVEDPYIQGCIGCANVLSDIYSLGISRVDTVLMLVAASSDMDQESSYKVTELMMKGFMKTAEKAHTKVTGGQTVKNAWPIIGGVATSVVQESEMIRPDNLAPGDVLVLTKPLGTQIAVNLYQKWRKSPSSIDWKITDNEILAMYNSAVASMMHLNQKAAELLKRHAAHGATDITGFGIFGHTNNLARAQKRKIYIEIDTLPCLKRSPLVANEIFDSKFNLLGGTLAETSGGLLIAFPSVRKAEEFQFDLLKEDGCESWIIGTVLERFDDEVSNYAVIKKDQLKILEVFFNKTELGH